MLLTIFLLIMLLVSCLLLYLVSSALLGFLRTRVPFVPTAQEDIEFLIKQLNIKPKDIFFDLGSGNGRVCFLVNKLTGAKCVGFELTGWTHLLARAKRLWLRAKGVKFKNQNFFKVGWQEANYIYAYLYPPLMKKVEKKFLSECHVGTVAIIRDFPLPFLKPVNKYRLKGGHEFYIYRKSEQF